MRARRLRRTLTISVVSLSGWDEVGASALSALLLLSLALPEPLLMGRCSFSALEGFDGRRCLGGGLVCPVLLPT